MGALVIGSYLEGGARAGRGFLEDQSDILAGQPGLLVAAVLGSLEIGRKIE
jgi:hypothetical protein